MNSKDLKPDMISQTENFLAWKVDEPDGETTWHLDLNNITVHFFQEEWEEFLDFKKLFVDLPQGATGTLAENDVYFLGCEKLDSDEFVYSLEISGATLYYFDDDWKEICELLRAL